MRRTRVRNGVKDPYLYTAQAVLTVDGKEADSVETRFGVRDFATVPKNGFYLNGKRYPLHGVSRHQDRKGIGSALTKEMHLEDMDMICEMGVNTVRLAHYQHDQYFYDLCDERGMVVWAEIPYISEHMPNGRENTISQMKELIIQNYNHPSIVCWGVSNEITISTKDNADMLDNHHVLNDLCHEMDKTRFTTLACYAMCGPFNKVAHITDVVSWNLYLGWYVPGFKLNDLWIDFFDFAADARDQGGEPGMNHKGLVTFDRRTKKDSFYLYKAWWNEKDPFVHICSKRFVDRAEAKIEIKVHSCMMGDYDGLYMPMMIVGYIFAVPFFALTVRTSQKKGQKASLMRYVAVAFVCYIGVLALLLLWNPNTSMHMQIMREGKFALNFYTIAFILCFGIGYGAYYATADMPIPMVADCADYETYRSGKFIPGIMGTLFSLVDKLVSSLSATVVGVAVTIIGLDALPTKATPYTEGMNVVVIILFCVVPMCAWALTLWSMTGYELDGERVKEIQEVNGKRREAIAQGMTIEEAMEKYPSR